MKKKHPDPKTTGCTVSPSAALGEPRHPAKMLPGRLFSIPADVKYLDTLQLAALTSAFRAWAEKVARPDVQRARTRVLIAYLILRHTGCRLSEALELDDRDNLECQRHLVRFRAANTTREVQIPADVADQIALLLDRADLASLRGALLKIDPGHLRRKFYERAAEAGLPKELANPAALRRSRGIELLREGVPLTVVQNLLGQSSANLTAAFLDFSDEDVKKITSHVLRNEKRKTSARNAFFGKVTAIRAGDVVSEVELATLGGYTVVSVVTNDSVADLDLKPGVFATATIKAPWIILAKGQAASARNKFFGRVVQIVRGAVVSEVILELDDGTRLCSLVTDQSVSDLNIAAGDGIWAICKAFAVILNVD